MESRKCAASHHAQEEVPGEDGTSAPPVPGQVSACLMCVSARYDPAAAGAATAPAYIAAGAAHLLLHFTTHWGPSAGH